MISLKIKLCTSTTILGREQTVLLQAFLWTLIPKLKTYKDNNYLINEEKKNLSNKKIVDRIVYWFGNRSTQLIPC